MPTTRGIDRGRPTLSGFRRAIVGFLAAAGMAAVAAGAPLPLGDGGIVYPDGADFNGDKATDTIVLLPYGDGERGEGGIAGNCTIGEVQIHSGTTGQVIVRFLASTCDDAFGSSVSIIRDLNADGNDDLIIGAPLNGTGRAYVFFGPFGTGTGTQEIYADAADMQFFGPAGFERLGERVGSVSDITGDGVPDLRIRGRATSGTGSLIRTFFVSGTDGFPLFVSRGSTPFNPWLRPQADVDDDGDVDTDDLAIVAGNQGMSGPAVTIWDGDVNNDDAVNAADLTIVQNGQGINQFAPIDIGTDPDVGGDWGIWVCPPTIASNYWCVPNCWDFDLYLPINVDPLCLPLICQAWCGFTIVDHGAPLMPFETYSKPYVSSSRMSRGRCWRAPIASSASAAMTDRRSSSFRCGTAR
jgi:FG-GAP repeat